METLGEREVTDMIEDLRASEKMEGTCKEHGLITRSAILSHRQQEQIFVVVTNIQTEMNKLVAAESNGMNFIGGFKFGKRQASGLVAIVFLIGLFFCLYKWGPTLAQVWNAKPVKAVIEKSNG